MKLKNLLPENQNNLPTKDGKLPSRQNFKVGDRVIIVRGKDKGERAKVVKVEGQNSIGLYLYSIKDVASWYSSKNLRPDPTK